MIIVAMCTNCDKTYYSRVKQKEKIPVFFSQSRKKFRCNREYNKNVICFTVFYTGFFQFAIVFDIVFDIEGEDFSWLTGQNC